VIFRHGVRSAITPIVTILGWTSASSSRRDPHRVGVQHSRHGRLAFDSIQKSDLPTVQGTVIMGAFFIIVLNLVVDVLYAFLDRASGTESMALLEVEDLRSTSIPTTASSRPSTVSRTASSAARLLASWASRARARACRRSRSWPHAVLQVRSDQRSVKFDGKELLTASGRGDAPYPRNEIAMIFQDPLSSLHPSTGSASSW